ncbi:GNAT family N-acetyltransferase [Methylobacterium trifolii]|uniref:GNAT family N-acetyltransferase n=1 Tax=Methylobacterium trifolii TaxID=1003092 RepID=A0ABQ4U5B2_9HYPH|nr:GNAT family N-acetyltransferase [Methylobacterium trifolii]GJE62641.1 hypothetical protein MPOCJGCO_4774 [Methylobacterium trifolii]
MSRFTSEVLGKRERGAFGSGNATIDTYFRTAVLQDVKRNHAACYVLVEKATGTLAGFYTLSSTGIPLSGVPPEIARRLPRNPTIPAVLIGWLGRDSAFRGQEIGAMLLHDAIVRVVPSPVGAYALVADAIDDAAASFYAKHQFTPFASRPKTAFLPLATARNMIGGAG